jgi:hypothetical protein
LTRESFTFSAGANEICFKIMREEGQLNVTDELKHHFEGISSEINQVLWKLEAVGLCPVVLAAA